MNAEQILKEMNAIFVDVLDDSGILLTTRTEAKDIEQWDSLNHIQLVVAMEKHFKIKFNANEIRSWKNVGEIITSIESRINK